MSVGEFKSNFSEIIKRVLAGGGNCHFLRKEKEMGARLVPKAPVKKPKMKIAILEAKAKITFHAAFKMSEEEFLGL